VLPEKETQAMMMQFIAEKELVWQISKDVSGQIRA
jgi:hypothetical protein